MIKTISELESEIRDYINHPRKLHALVQNDVAWNALCSALDVIGDTELGIQAYLSDEWPNTDGHQYLLIYGILQMLYVQQDAIIEINQALGLHYVREQDLKKIRELRNKSIGHPAKRSRRGEKTSSHFIARYSLNKNGFQLMSVHEGVPTPEFTEVDVLSLIQEQQSLLMKTLQETINKLQEEEMTHRQKFKDIKLEALFSLLRLNYPLSKIDDEHQGAVARHEIQEAFNSFKNKLEERGELIAVENLKDDFNQVTHALNRLEAHFSQEINLDSEDIQIYRFFLGKKVKEFNKIAKDIDEEYESDDINY